LNSCKELSTLDLDEFTDSLVDEATLAAIAKHQSIRTLRVNKLIDASLASAIVGIARPFNHLVNHTINATPEAAGILLPCLEQLEFFLLCLGISGTGSVFPVTDVHLLYTEDSL